MMGAKINFTKEDKEKIVNMYKDGMSAVNIGKVYGCSRTPIKQILHEYGIVMDNVLRKIPKSEYQNIIDLYNSGKTQNEIGEIYGCGKHIIYTIMKKLNVPARPNGFTKDTAEQMYEMHKQGHSLSDIACKYNTNRHTVGQVLKRNGLIVDRKKYHCDEHYFDVIDTPDKAYILGFLWADGYNNTNIGKITLQLQERDKKILEDISELLHSDMPLWFSNLHDKNANWSNAYMLSLRSKHMSTVLESYGMIQRKSLVLTFPEWIDASLYPHFIRGYMDGDGSIYYRADRNILRVSFVGTKMFLETVQHICSEHGIKTSLYHKSSCSDVIFSLYTTGNKESHKLLQWIYDAAELKLDRKYNKYQQFLHDKNVNNLK